MGLFIFLAILVLTTEAVPVQKNQPNDVEKFITILPESKTNPVKVDPLRRILKKQFTTKPSVFKESSKKSGFLEKNSTNDGSFKKNRKEKNSFLSSLTGAFGNKFRNQNHQDKSNKQQYQESNVYYIKLPPTPYVYVPGLGYVSQPPSYSFPSRPKPSTFNKNQVPLTKVPIDFVSNGKPTSVYSYAEPNSNPKSSPTISLDKGPYVFNGIPVSFYLLDPSGRPLQRRTFNKFADYSKAKKDYL